MPSFQKKVYSVVRNIPGGKVLSYRQVAILLGRRRAWRAVGNILNKNADPELVPCHRVIRSDGSLGGFGAGLRAKRNLLALEGLRGLPRTPLSGPKSRSK